MKKLIVVVSALTVLGTTLAARAPRAEPAAFSLTLEQRPKGWAARCASGCKWSAASFECETACNAIVDSDGLVTLATARHEQPAFSFTVERTADGVLARARHGTAWTTLSWGCVAQPCRGRIDGVGVAVASSPR